MGPLQWFLFVYVLGGLTFVPLLLAATLYIGWRTLPQVDPASAASKAKDPANLIRSDDDTDIVLKTATDDLAEKFHRKHDSDVAAGYFAVCREFVPGGVNGKPPERMTAAGETIAQESPSVYQTMYRSLFDRSNKPTIEPQKDGAGKSVKRANNIFYVVLRHGHLMLYDDIQQLEVRYVISLEYHDVDIYSGEEGVIPEGELWVKRHAIRLTRKASKDASQKPTLPFFLFTENLSEKEDFYHALLKNQERNSSDTPIVDEFDPAYIVKLVQQLHSSEEQLQTRWLNAFIGRLFLATYKTPELEDYIRNKLTKKIARVKKPTFITRISLHKVDTGTGAPFITNPRLKDFTVNGDCLAEADVEYTGGFRIEIGATARIDLGKRFGAREVDMVLAVTLKKVQGHVLIRCKPPPSNRIWFTFEKMPQMDLALEPIVSSRKITYSMILGAMESRIREVFAESLVMPFWDDVPFFDTAGQKFRGGIWKREKTAHSTEIKDETPEDEAETDAGEAETIKAIKADARNWSMPALALSDDGGAVSKGDRRSIASIAADAISEGSRTPPARTPRVLRAPSFAGAADPMVTANHVDSAASRTDPDATPKREAAAILKDLSTRSGSPSDQPEGSPPKESAMSEAMKGRSDSNASKKSADSIQVPSRASTMDFSRPSTSTNEEARPSTPSSTSMSRESKRASTQDLEKPVKPISHATRSLTTADRRQALASATAAAQKWTNTIGWGVLARKQKDGSEADRGPSSPRPDGTPSAPMGRGQPLPPPGQPLPKPSKPNIMSNIPNFMVPRKPTLPKRPDAAESADTAQPKSASPAAPPPLPDRRRRQSTMHSREQSTTNDDDLLVVEAPADSTPNSPEVERVNNVHRDSFFNHSEANDNDHDNNNNKDPTGADRRGGLDEQRYGPPPPPSYLDASGTSEPSNPWRQGSDKDDIPPPSPALQQGSPALDKDNSSAAGTPDSSSLSLSSDKENSSSSRPPPLPLRQGTLGSVAAGDEGRMPSPRPPLPARTGSDNSSSDGRRLSSRIPTPSPSNSASLGSLAMRKPRELQRKGSNLSLGE